MECFHHIFCCILHILLNSAHFLHPPIHHIDDLVSFLTRCKRGLNRAGGVIGIKENVASELDDILDEEDSSYTRCLPSILSLVQRAGLRVIQQENQVNFPSTIYDVKMYVWGK